MLGPPSNTEELIVGPRFVGVPNGSWARARPQRAVASETPRTAAASVRLICHLRVLKTSDQMWDAGADAFVHGATLPRTDHPSTGRERRMGLRRRRNGVLCRGSYDPPICSDPISRSEAHT